jgi:DNA-binding IscR family transcriptional regulator
MPLWEEVQSAVDRVYATTSLQDLLDREKSQASTAP